MDTDQAGGPSASRLLAGCGALLAAIFLLNGQLPQGVAAGKNNFICEEQSAASVDAQI